MRPREEQVRKSVNIIIPYFGYAHVRIGKSKPRVAIAAKLIAEFNFGSWR